MHCERKTLIIIFAFTTVFSWHVADIVASKRVNSGGQAKKHSSKHRDFRRLMLVSERKSNTQFELVLKAILTRSDVKEGKVGATEKRKSASNKLRRIHEYTRTLDNEVSQLFNQLGIEKTDTNTLKTIKRFQANESLLIFSLNHVAESIRNNLKYIDPNFRDNLAKYSTEINNSVDGARAAIAKAKRDLKKLKKEMPAYYELSAFSDLNIDSPEFTDFNSDGKLKSRMDRAVQGVDYLNVLVQKLERFNNLARPWSRAPVVSRNSSHT